MSRVVSITDDVVAHQLARGIIDSGTRSLMETARELDVRARVVGRPSMIDLGAPRFQTELARSMCSYASSGARTRAPARSASSIRTRANTRGVAELRDFSRHDLECGGYLFGARPPRTPLDGVCKVGFSPKSQHARHSVILGTVEEAEAGNPNQPAAIIFDNNLAATIAQALVNAQKQLESAK
jgi:hypothetical protein